MVHDPEELLTHRAWLQAIARSLLGDASQADDVVQETWVAALKRPPRNEGDGRAWLRRVAHNLAYRTHRGDRRRGKRERAAARPERVGATPESLLERAEMQRLVAEAVTELSEPYRTTVLHRYFEGISAAEIAARQGVAVTTVRTRLRSALETLRRKLDHSFDGDRRRWCAILAPIALGDGAAVAATTAIATKTAATTGTASFGTSSVFLGGSLVTAKKVAITCLSSFLILAGGALLVYWTSNPGGETRTEPVVDSSSSPDSAADAPERAASVESDAVASTPPSRDELSEVATLSPPALGGTIRARDGQPIPGATVIAFRLGALDPPIDRAAAELQQRDADLAETLRKTRRECGGLAKTFARARSGETGDYAIPLLEPGEYRIVVAHSNHLPELDAHAAIAADRPARCDVELLEGLEIRGRVVDESSAPLPGAEISVRPSSERTLRGNARKDRLLEEWRDGRFLVESRSSLAGADGTFRVGSLASERYDLTVRLAGRAPVRRLDIPAGREALEIVLPLGAVVRGRVVHGNEMPIAGVDVRLEFVGDEKAPSPVIGAASFRRVVAADFDPTEEAVRASATDEEGRFEFAGVRSGPYVVRAELSGYAPREKKLDVGDDPVDAGDLILGDGGSIRGRLVDSEGMPIAAALVWIEAPQETGITHWGQAARIAPRLVEAETEFDGTFKLGGLAEGFYAVRAASEAHASVRLSGVAAGRSDVEITLPKGESVTGVVLNGIDDSPLEGAEIALAESSAHTPIPEKTVHSAADGRFELRGVEFRRGLVLLVSHVDFRGRPLRVSMEDDTRDVEVRLQPSILVAGIVLDAERKPVRSARVALEGQYRDSAPVRSEADGSFSLEISSMFREQSGLQYVVASDGRRGIGRVELPRDSGRHVDVDELEIVLEPTTTVEGDVRSADGNPVAGAIVTLQRRTNAGDARGPLRRSHSTRDGSFRILGLEPGVYAAHVVALGYAETTADIDVRSSRHTETFVLDRGIDLEGEVVDTAGDPVAGADVFLLATIEGDRLDEGSIHEGRKAQGETRFTTRTDENGIYVFRNLPETEWTVYAHSSGFDASDLAVVPPGEEPPELVLARFGRVFGRVVSDATGEPLPSFRVHLNLAKNRRGIGGSGMLLPRQYATRDGSFLVEGVAPGEYFIVVEAPGHSYWGREFTVPHGGDAKIDARLDPGRILRGVVLDRKSNAPVPGVRVFASNRAGKAWSRRVMPEELNDTTNEEGEFAIRSVQPGRYSLWIHHPTYFAEQKRMKAEIPADGEASPLEIGVLPSGTVTGTIRLLTKRNSFNRSVRLTRPGETDAAHWSRIDESGKYRIRSVVPGTYEISFREESLVPEKVGAPAGTPIDFETDIIRTSVSLGEVEVEAGATARFDQTVE